MAAVEATVRVVSALTKIDGTTRLQDVTVVTADIGQGGDSRFFAKATLEFRPNQSASEPDALVLDPTKEYVLTLEEVV